MHNTIYYIRLTLILASSLIFVSACSNDSGPDSQVDLVITDIYTKSSNPSAVYIKYVNLGNTDQGQDFLIKLSSSKGSFSGNINHRFAIPTPNTEMETGAYKLDLLSLADNENAQITAEIDWEGRTNESDESNNSFSKIVYRY
ncbi:MAG: hypothetical protein OEY36_05020 [Gammaproteobacteria bacterium]|nr:hypothetical protein [Gammaproteobacteria bacterium]